MRIHRIEPGQIYRGIGKLSHVRVKVFATYGDGIPGLTGSDWVCIATLTKEGRAVRKRDIKFSQLHYSKFTWNGRIRRSGYVLEGGN